MQNCAAVVFSDLYFAPFSFSFRMTVSFLHHLPLATLSTSMPVEEPVTGPSWLSLEYSIPILASAVNHCQPGGLHQRPSVRPLQDRGSGTASEVYYH